MPKLLKRLIVVGLLVAAGTTAVLILARKLSPPKASPAAAAALAYLLEIQQVEWHVIDGNAVYVGFHEPLPKDWKTTIEGAAVNASRAANSEFHAWAVPAANEKFRPGVDRSFGEAVARNGKIE